MSEGGPTLATRACSTCRRGKRRCTKEIPTCSLCRKNGKQCDYGTVGSPATDSESPIQRPSNSHPPNRPAQSTLSVAPPPPPSFTVPVPANTDFPALFFLDSSYFELQKHSLEKQRLNLPQELMGRLSRQAQMRYDADVFFSSVHTFLPIVSKIRLYQELGGADAPLNADTTLLLVAMQLHTQPVDSNSPHRDLYRIAKDCFSFVEASNIFSIRLLQAGLLIALYEISNAIYPAAYLSVGHCGRLGYAMGIHDRRRAPQMLGLPKTSTELEERRRVWWAVIILDRYVNLGSKYRPFACKDARPDDFLPIDDKDWDQGVNLKLHALAVNAHLQQKLSLVQPLAVSTNTEVQVPPFARTCQAAHLLSRVLRHLNDSDTDPEFRFQEAIQLHRTSQALYSTILRESEAMVERMSDLTAHLPFSTAIGLCLSTLLSLYDNYACTERNQPDQMGSPTFLEMQKTAITGVKEISSAVFQFSGRIRAVAELGGMLRTSPLICDCLYHSAANYLWYIQESGNQELVPTVAGIKETLRMLGTRWDSPREYLRILDSYELSEGLSA